MAFGRRTLLHTRAVGDTALVTTTGSTAPAAGQAAIIFTSPVTVAGERDDGDGGLIERRAAATQPPSLSKVHALQRLTEGARTRSPELEGGFTVPGSKKSVGPHL